MLVALSKAFDLDALDRLLLLEQFQTKNDEYLLTGDGLLHFAGLVASGLAKFTHKQNQYYTIALSERGRLIVAAWRQGRRVELKRILSDHRP